MRGLIKAEEKRQQGVINLIASENFASKEVREASGSVLTNKYSEGYPGRRYYAGNEIIDKVERLAQERALKLFKLNPARWGVNVQALSGVPANFLVYSALIEPGQKIAGQALDQGGHLSHGSKVSLTSKFWHWVHYTVDRKTEILDYKKLASRMKREKPRMIVAGYSAYSQKLDFKKFRKIADSVGALLMVDMAHFAGLVAGGVYPSPFPYADIITTTTHKTLRGPRGALIFARKIQHPTSNFQLSELIDKAVFPGGQGGPHDHQTAAIAVALREAMQPPFKKYARQIVKNAKVLADELKKKGWRIVSGGTDNHLFLVDVWSQGLAGKDAESILESAGIIINRNGIPYDSRSPFNPSGIRIGTPAVTTRGMKEKEMVIIAGWIDGLLKSEISPLSVKKEVARFVKKFPIKQ